MLGAVYWIDHYTIPTNDLKRSIAFNEATIGAMTIDHAGIPAARGVFQAIGHVESSEPLTLKASGVHQGLFFDPTPLPAPAEPGATYPRYALFIDPRDIDGHVRRLAANEVRYMNPIRSAEFGASGTSILWVDIDGNQREFWAPDVLPPGAIEAGGRFRVGRISHVVYGSRDLARTAAFFGRFCGLEALSSPDVGPDTLVLPLRTGGRLAFKKVDAMALRVSGRGVFSDLHTALVVSEPDFWLRYERLWAELPEWEYDSVRALFIGNGESLPARTLMHGSPDGRRLKAALGRGDDWLDPDGNLFHFVGGVPRNGSMLAYERFVIGEYLDAYLARAGNLTSSESGVPLR